MMWRTRQWPRPHFAGGRHDETPAVIVLWATTTLHSLFFHRFDCMLRCRNDLRVLYTCMSGRFLFLLSVQLDTPSFFPHLDNLNVELLSADHPAKKHLPVFAPTLTLTLAILHHCYREHRRIQRNSTQMEAPSLLFSSSSFGSRKNTQGNKYRMKYCRKFAFGQCTLGDSCSFIHASSTSIPPFNESSPFVSPPPLSRPFEVSYPHTIGEAQTTTAHYSRTAPRSAHKGPLSALEIQQHSSTIIGFNGSQTGSGSETSPLSTSHSGFAAPHPLIPYKPLSWRTVPCRHFVRHKGWCPLGDACNFIHDLSFQPENRDGDGHLLMANPLQPDHPSDSRSTGGKADYRIVSGGVSVGLQRPHCWAFVQGQCRVQECRYLHPRNIEPYIRYTPCLTWPNCVQGNDCLFRHPALTMPSPRVIPNAFAPQQEASPNAVLPHGAYEVDGTTYFLPNILRSPRREDEIVSLSHQFSHGIYPYANYWTPPSVNAQTFDSCSDDAPEGNDDQAPTAIQQSPEFQDKATQSGTPADQIDTNATEKQQFPYQPPQNQRRGHTRRISVVVKSHGTSSSCQVTEESMARVKRENRKSWAAFSPPDRGRLALQQTEVV